MSSYLLTSFGVQEVGHFAAQTKRRQLSGKAMQELKRARGVQIASFGSCCRVRSHLGLGLPPAWGTRERTRFATRRRWQSWSSTGATIIRTCRSGLRPRERTAWLRGTLLTLVRPLRYPLYLLRYRRMARDRGHGLRQSGRYDLRPSLQHWLMRDVSFPYSPLPSGKLSRWRPEQRSSG